MQTLPVNYYAVLGVANHAEDIVIRAAYRALMQRHHPDKNIQSENTVGLNDSRQKILGIQEAYRVLSDVQLRKAYDRKLGTKAVNVLRVVGPTVMERTGLSTERIHSLDTHTWQALLKENPRFSEHFMRLTKTHPHIADEYKTLILELIAERVMAKMVNRLCQEFDSTDANVITQNFHAN